MYKKYMIVCEVFCYFIFGMYCLFFHLGSQPGQQLDQKTKTKKVKNN